MSIRNKIHTGSRGATAGSRRMEARLEGLLTDELGIGSQRQLGVAQPCCSMQLSQPQPQLCIQTRSWERTWTSPWKCGSRTICLAVCAWAEMILLLPRFSTLHAYTCKMHTNVGIMQQASAMLQTHACTATCRSGRPSQMGPCPSEPHNQQSKFAVALPQLVPSTS